MAAAGSSAVPVSDAELLAADAKFNEGMRLMDSCNYEEAANSLSKCLETRVRKYGDLASECGTAYLRYGEALFLHAQQSTDVFGASVQKLAAEKDNGGSGEAPNGPPDAGGKSAAAPKDKGKGPAVAAAKGEGEDVNSEGEDADGDDEEGAAAATAVDADADAASAEAPPKDDELSWEVLELARVIFARDDGSSPDLAEVYALQGDHLAEQEAFGEAAAKYGESLAVLGATPGCDPRLEAEIHFKLAAALQWQSEYSEALVHVRKAAGLIHTRWLHAKSAAAAASAPGGGDPAAAAAAERAESGLASVLADMRLKEDELCDCVTQQNAQKAAVRAAMAAANAGLLAAGGEGATTSGFGGSSLAAGAGPVVTNLGVVGRTSGGRARITLAPVGPVQAVAAPDAPPPAKKARDTAPNDDLPPLI